MHFQPGMVCMYVLTLLIYDNYKSIEFETTEIRKRHGFVQEIVRTATVRTHNSYSSAYFNLVCIAYSTTLIQQILNKNIKSISIWDNNLPKDHYCRNCCFFSIVDTICAYHRQVFRKMRLFHYRIRRVFPTCSTSWYKFIEHSHVG